MWGKKFESHDLLTNVDQYGRSLAILHHKADDERGGEPSYEGAEHLDPAVRNIMRNTRLKFHDLGVVDIPFPEGAGFDKFGNPNNLDPIVDSAAKAGDRVHQAILDGHVVLSLGGNHVRALDLIGAARACHELGIPFSVIWKDEHADLNTPETTDTGAVHGMGAAVSMGRGAKELLALFKGAPFVDPKNFIYIGVGDIDNNMRRKDGSMKKGTELTLLQELKKKGVQCFDMNCIKKGRAQGVVPDEVKHAIEKLNRRMKKKGGATWVEWDVDVVDKTDMPAAVMENNDGMSAEQIYDIANFIGHRCNVIGIGVSEFAPKKDKNGQSTEVVAKGVAHLLGIHDPSYQEHMSVHGFQTGNVAPLAIPQPMRRRKKSSWEKKALGIAAGTAAAIGAVIAGREMLHPSSSAPNKPAVVDTTFVKNLPENSLEGGKYLTAFQRWSGFRKYAKQFRDAVDRGDEKGQKKTVAAMAAAYEQFQKNAPDQSSFHHLGDVALSEFYEGFGLTGGLAGQYYTRFLQALRPDLYSGNS